MPRDFKPHALVIGGSGMLKNICFYLAKTYKTTVIARNEKNLITLSSKNENIIPLPFDYNNIEALLEKLKHNDYQVILAWIHQDDTEILNGIIKQFTTNCKIYHVLGSKQNGIQVKKQITPSHHLTYFQIQLGFKIENDAKRWLTHDEICKGVIESLQNNKDITVGRTKNHLPM